ncbi:flagellar motor switch protein FliG (plasmid) [Rossellomorea sp. AcN35-11]|nr:flagellar motor switch protein FliG [Rossellomorea aquimaris]WJV32280.1 flagellar motor switch protein FliG [Rossellomorea sp. AcN35-11]
MRDDNSKMNGFKKAAILFISLGPDVAAELFKHLTENEIEQLTLEISKYKKVDSNTKRSVLEEFKELALAQDFLEEGGIDYAKSILEKAMGSDAASSVIQKLTTSLQVRPFEFARQVDVPQLLNFLQSEHPQTIALVLSYLEPDKAGMILSELPNDIQKQVSKRIAKMERTSPNIVHEVESVLESKLSTHVDQEFNDTGGIEALVEVLNGVDRATEKTILDSLMEEDPELAEEVKKRMFVFEDIVILDNRSIQRVLKDVDTEDLKYAMKASGDEVKELLFKNMSSRMAESLKEDLEIMGPVRLKDVEEAQTKIVDIIRRLEEAGDIVVARGGGDDFIV